MTENIDPFAQIVNDAAQLKALMQVIDEITGHKVPLIDTADVVTNRNIRNLEKWVLEYVMDDGDLVHDLKSAVIEIKYLASIVKDLRGRLAELDAQIENMRADNQMMADRLRRGN